MSIYVTSSSAVINLIWKTLFQTENKNSARAVKIAPVQKMVIVIQMYMFAL